MSDPVDAEIRDLVRKERPVMTLRANPVPARLSDGPFRAVQEVPSITARVQERLDAIAVKLLGEVPRLPELQTPSAGSGLLGLTETVCRNAVTRAQHMDRVLDLLEQELS